MCMYIYVMCDGGRAASGSIVPTHTQVHVSVYPLKMSIVGLRLD